MRRTNVVTIPEAAAAGLSWAALQTTAWQRACPGVYAPASVQRSNELLLRAFERRLPGEAAFSGPTAAWIHGLDVEPTQPIDVTLPAGHKATRRVGVRLHRACLDPSEVVVRRGFRVTSGLRTAADLASGANVIEAVALLDMALHQHLSRRADLESLLSRTTGRKGCRRLRRALELCDPASESPMESRLRAALVLAGLPSPLCQVELHDEAGVFLARVDMYYSERRICIEYDGGSHRTSMTEDNRRQNKLIAAGYTVLRFTAADLVSIDRTVGVVAYALGMRPKLRFVHKSQIAPPPSTAITAQMARGAAAA